MTTMRTNPDPNAQFKFVREAWAYLTGPKTYLESIDLEHTGHVLQALKFLLLGALVAIGVSYANVRFLGIPGGDATKKFFEGTVLTHALFLVSVVGIVVAYLAGCLLSSSGLAEPNLKWRRTWVALAYHYAYSWPLYMLGLVCVGQFVRRMLGDPSLQMPPFIETGASPVLERTPGNVFVIAVAMATLAWLMLFFLWGFLRAVMVAQGLKWGWAVLLTIVYVGVFGYFGAKISEHAHDIANVLDPFLGAIFKGQ